MFSNLMNCIPSVKDSISYIFDYYLGIKLNLSNLCFDDNNNLFIQLTNINIEASRINHNYLKNINIKLTKGIIGKIEIRIGTNTFEIKISKLSIMLMPVVTTHQNENLEKKEDLEKKEENKEKENNKNDSNRKGIIASFIEYYLGKLKISIEEIELITFNYEIINKNITYANPVLSFNIYNIKYDNGEINEIKNKIYIRKNIWENKHFSIDGICLKISKSFKTNNSNYQEISTNNINNNIKGSIALSKKGDTKNNKISFDKNNNDNILLINSEKGIHFYTNVKNEILGEIGDIQLVINLFQLELLKNYINTYSLFLNVNDNNNTKKDINKKKENINIIKSNISNDNSITNSSSIIDRSNNEIMNLKIKINSFSVILLEKNQNPSEVKFYEFNKDKMIEHFCYFENNFFMFLLYNFCFQYDNKKKLISLTLEEIALNYIEYNSKTKKEEEIEFIARTESEYSDCNESIIFKSNETFHQTGEPENSFFNIKEYYCSYDYKYNKNQIILIKNIDFGLNYSFENKKKLKFELNSFNVNFHPIFLFKLLKILYENSFLIKEVLFYNYQQINDEEAKNNEKEEKEEDLMSKEDSQDNNIINTNSKKENIIKENEENLDLSFLTCEEGEEDEKEKGKNNKDNNNKSPIIKEENIIYSSDIIFKKDEPEEKINDKIKKILSTLNIELEIKAIEIRVYSFKCEENFYNIINPFFNEFYFDHIYIMDMKDDYREKKFKINEISSSDYFNLIIKNLSIKNDKNKNGEELLLKFFSIASSFNDNRLMKILSSTYPVKYNLDKNKIIIDLSFNFDIKVKLLPYMLSFVNIWNYTLLIFGIFQKRMIYNYNKGKDELEKMNFDDNILKYFEKNKKLKDLNRNNIEEDNNKILEEENKLTVEIGIREIIIKFAILPKKINSEIRIKNIKLKYIKNDNIQKIEFSINEIESNHFKFYINEIKLDLKIKEIKINRNLLNNSKSKNSKKSNNFNSCLIVPEQTMEIYIDNIIQLKKKKKELEKSNNDHKNDQILDFNALIKDIQLEPLESLLYINDIYNIIVKEEIYNNYNINSQRKKLYNSRNLLSTSISSRDSILSISNKDNNASLTDLNENNQNIISNFDNEDNKESLSTINFSISSINCIINDENNKRTIELNIKDINLKNNNIFCDSIEFLIFYEIKDLANKVKIDIGKINNIQLNQKNKNKNTLYNIIIDEISFSFCNDSFSYIQNILNDINNLMSNCFVKGQKSNKILITKNTNKLLNTYDLEENPDQRESELFGTNVAKSVCLVSNKNEFKIKIDENYLDNLKNEKEEPSQIIDDIYKSELKLNLIKNNDENNLSFIINKINFGLFSGFDFEATLDIKTKQLEYENKNKEKEINDNLNNNNKNNINNVNNVNVNKEKDFNEKIKELQNSLLNNNGNKIKNNLNISENKNIINNNEIKHGQKEADTFEIIEFNPKNKINAREKNNYLLISIENINLSILYAKKNSYEIEFVINDLEIIDNLQESTFKRLLSAKKNIELNEDKKKFPFLSIFVDISNSKNELSTNDYKDFNITCEITLASLRLMIHQNSLLFILNFFIKNEKIKKKEIKNNNVDNFSIKLYNSKQYHTDPSFVLDSVFNQIIVEDYGDEQNDLIEDKNFLYITNFLFREFEIIITYESEYGFSFQNIFIPILPGIKDYAFSINRITYKGFVTLAQFTDYFFDRFVGQLSKYNIVYEFLKSMSWTSPIFNIFGDFFDIFISPFQSYRKNQGFMNGLFKGLKKFFFNLLSKNIYVGEKMIRTLTTFIGVTKNNNIGKNSFYEKYILTDEKKKIYDYFYK